MSILRVRQHVNPLSQKYQEPATAIAWDTYYADPDQPLYLDIGCARGRFLLDLSQLHPEWNFLGIEIRQSLVEQANLIRDRWGLRNLHYAFANANIAVQSLCPRNSLSGAFIQFPDPWFKRRQQKRRLVQSSLVEDLAVCLRPGGFVFLQSDLLELAQQMRDRFHQHPAFEPQTSPEEWLTANPLPVPTERELSTLELGKPVYRCQFMKR
jgi:tRNA (guanine-N7-)-methyltransferase